jgi:2-amino-4-hydroxy-6-hydroxymethyldihydropteridine diphosphokinase
MDTGNNPLNPIRIFLGLGSNMGDRPSHLQKALKALSLKIKVLKVSGIYDTAPVGNTRQARFLNLVCEGQTFLSPGNLLTFAKEIEKTQGRKPGPVNGPRPIDIDIIFYGNSIINTPDLIIPHPRLTGRAFVLVPLAEIAPDFVEPVSGKTIKETLQNLRYNSLDVLKWEKHEVKHV